MYKLYSLFCNNFLTSSLFKGQNKVSLIISILQIFNGDLG